MLDNAFDYLDKLPVEIVCLLFGFAMSFGIWLIAWAIPAIWHKASICITRLKSKIAIRNGKL